MQSCINKFSPHKSGVMLFLILIISFIASAAQINGTDGVDNLSGTSGKNNPGQSRFKLNIYDSTG